MTRKSAAPELFKTRIDQHGLVHEKRFDRVQGYFDQRRYNQELCH